MLYICRRKVKPEFDSVKNNILIIVTMKHMKFLSLFFSIAFTLVACSNESETEPLPGTNPDDGLFFSAGLPTDSWRPKG